MGEGEVVGKNEKNFYDGRAPVGRKAKLCLLWMSDMLQAIPAQRRERRPLAYITFVSRHNKPAAAKAPTKNSASLLDVSQKAEGFTPKQPRNTRPTSVARNTQQRRLSLCSYPPAIANAPAPSPHRENAFTKRVGLGGRDADLNSPRSNGRHMPPRSRRRRCRDRPPSEESTGPSSDSKHPRMVVFHAPQGRSLWG